MDLRSQVPRSPKDLARQIKALPDVSDVYVPQDMDYPALQINVDRVRASELGLTPKEVISNVITALTSDVMIAPSYWVDPKNGNNYFVSVQYPENQVKSIEDLKSMPLRAPAQTAPTYLNEVANIAPFATPTEVDHYQLQRTIDIYVAPKGEDLGRPAKAQICPRIISQHVVCRRISGVNVRGLVVKQCSPRLRRFRPWDFCSPFFWFTSSLSRNSAPS